MVTRIEIAVKPGQRDGRGEDVASTVRGFLGIPVGRVRTRDVYRIDAELGADEAARILHEFVRPDPADGRSGTPRGRPVRRRGDRRVQAGRHRPGGQERAGSPSRTRSGRTLGRRRRRLHLAPLYLLDGRRARRRPNGSPWELLANPVIQTVAIQTYARVAGLAARPVGPAGGRARATAGSRRSTSPGSDDDAGERSAAKRLLALSLAEMRAIRDHFAAAAGRPAPRRARVSAPPPTDVELECLAQTWSEHCKHKIFNATITYRRAGPARGGRSARCSRPTSAGHDGGGPVGPRA